MNIYEFHTNPESLDSFKEVSIANPRLAYQCAEKLGRRLPIVETAIAKNALYAYLYARDVIEGRFPEGEAVIAKDGWSAAYYAKDVIKGRWLEAEEVIASSAEGSYNYAISVLKDRFIPGEFEISDSRYKYKYEDFFGIEL